MSANRTIIVLEVAALLVFLVVFEWLAHVLTNTQKMFWPAVLILGIYGVLRIAVFPKRTRQAGGTTTSADR